MPYYETEIRSGGRPGLRPRVPFVGWVYPLKLRTAPSTKDAGRLEFEVAPADTPLADGATPLTRRSTGVEYIGASTNNSEHALPSVMLSGWMPPRILDALGAETPPAELAALNRFLGRCGVTGVRPMQRVLDGARRGEFVARAQLGDSEVTTVDGQTRTLEAAELAAAGLDLVIASLQQR